MADPSAADVGRAEARRRRCRRGLTGGAGIALVAGLAFGAPILSAAPADAQPHRGVIVVARQAGEGPQLPVDPETDPDEVRRGAEEILDQPEYQAPEQPGETVFDRIRRAIADRLPKINGPGRGTQNFGSLVVVGIVLLTVLAGVAWLVASSRRSRAAPDADADIDVDITPLRSPTEWTREAERCQRDGDHRGAVRARFRALVASLAARDLVADTPGRTAGELRDDLSDRAPALSAVFAPMADLFERAWFGSDSAGPAESAAARDLAERVLDAAPRRPQVAAGLGDGTDR